jgi:Flp pilus assembly protein TadG
VRGLIPSRRRGDEQGAVIILMAVFSLVIVAVAALVVDVGSMLDEKRQLQNGADAAALAVAQSCAGGACNAAAAQSLADQNAHDAHAHVDTPTPAIDLVNKKVTVTLSTQDAGGGTILPYSFGQVITGQKGKTLHATATAGWSGLKSAKVIPLTLSLCEFNRATSTNTVFNVPTVIVFHANATHCTSGPSGADLSGGYGWVRDNNDSNPNDCNVTPTVGDTVNEDTGLPGTPHSCDLKTLLDTDVLVPIYNSLTGSGANGIYRIYGFGELHLTGFFFSTSDRGADTSGNYPCSKPATCVGGYFIKFVGIGANGGPNVGNRVALLS